MILCPDIVTENVYHQCTVLFIYMICQLIPKETKMPIIILCEKTI